MVGDGQSGPRTLGELLAAHEEQLRRGVVSREGGPVLLEVTRLDPEREIAMTALDIAGDGPPRRPWTTQKIEVRVATEAPQSGRVEEIRALVALTDPTARVFAMAKAAVAVNDSPNLCVGRAKRNDILIQDNTVSSVHAYFETSGGVLRLVDMNSANGTYLNGEQLAGGVAAPVKSGDAVRFGSTVFYYLTGYRFLLFLDLFLQRRNAG